METSTESLNLINLLMPLAAIIFMIAVGVVLLNQQFHKNLYREQLEKEALNSRYQQELLFSGIQVQENERKRIAQDLHDELGAILTISRMQMVQLEKQSDKPHIQEGLINLRELTENAISSLRRISHELMPLQLESAGLIPTLERLAVQVNQTGATKLLLTTEGQAETLNWLYQLVIYRSCLELINNCLKHADARHISINLCFSDNLFTCHYTDDGKGLNLTDNNHLGLGIKGLESRIGALGGNVSFGNHQPQGLTVKVHLPIQTFDNDTAHT